MLVFGFHRGPDFANDELTLGRTLTRPAQPSRGRGCNAKRFFVNAGRPLCGAINVVFTRIVNDYSIVHGTTAGCSKRGPFGRAS
jgi:hypothetical protein